MAASLFVGNIAEGTVYFLMTKLASVLEKEASLLRGVSHEIEEIKQELQSIRSFLVEVDRRKDTSEGITTWATQVRDVAYEVEDIIDEFIYHVSIPQKSGIIGKLHSVIQAPGGLIAKHQIATRLQRIKATVQAISDRRNRYRLQQVEERSSSHGSNEEWNYQRDSSIFIGEDDIVGIDENRDLLIGWLTEEEEEQQRLVLSVVGMGGLGKTTLVNKAYNNQMVKGHFDCHAWITVSQTYQVEELLRNMGNEFLKAKEPFPSDISSMSYPRLAQTLTEYVHSKRYVIILDDVWSIDVWNNIKFALPDNRRGSRIIITTRNVDVSSALGDMSHVFYLEPLNQSDSWSLFCKKAFWSDPNKSCPEELEPLARIIVEKCEGLPLAIIAVGGLMSSKDTTELEWRKVYSSLGWELSNNPILERVKSILLLSFTNMPYYLKLCFLYCSVFPEDYVIKRKRLIRLWIAEGFVEERRGMTMEEVADTYLKELICRNMLQLAKINYFGRVKACRVHDIIRDLALSMCEKENFCLVCDGKENMEDRRRPRRLSIQSCRNLLPGRAMSVSHLRSFFAFVPDVSSATSLHATLSKFRLLRVLDLQGVPIHTLPSEMLELFNLRYLSLKGTKVKEIPKSLSSLHNLQTLDLRDTHIERLPSGINKLLKLRHLLVFRYLPKEFSFPFHFSHITGLPVSRGIGKLNNLQTLTCIRANEEVIQEIRNLSQLRRFSIINVRASDGRSLSTSIRNMRQLLYLIVMANEEDEPLNLEALYPPPPFLQKLVLGGQLDRLPQWFTLLSNLSFLSLHGSNLKEDPLPLLGRLPNLTRLLLQKPYAGKHMLFKAGWFPKLKTLSLWELARVNQVEVEEGAMPNIQQLWMGFSQEIKMLPQGIEYLTTLKQLYLEEMPDELVQDLRDKKSKDHWKVQHIPSIKLTDRDRTKIESLPK